MVLATLANGAILHGQEVGSIVTDRPDRTESAESVPAGFTQFELGWTFTGDDTDTETVRSHSLPESLLRIGLGGGVEGRIGFAGYVLEDRSMPGDPGPASSSSGVADTQIGLKVEITEWEGGKMAVLGGVSLPTGADEFSSRRVDPTLLLLMAHPLGERVGLGYNVGVAWATETLAGDVLDTQVEVPYSLSFGFGLTDRLAAFLEGFGAFGLDSLREDTHSIDGGFTFLLSDAAQLDLSGGVGLNEAADDWFVGAGFSFRLPG